MTDTTNDVRPAILPPGTTCHLCNERASASPATQERSEPCKVPGFAANELAFAGSREAVLSCAAEIRAVTEELRPLIERGHALIAVAFRVDGKVRSQLRDYEIKMSVQADDGLGHFLSNLTGLEELHDALYTLGDLATPA